MDFSIYSFGYFNLGNFIVPFDIEDVSVEVVIWLSHPVLDVSGRAGVRNLKLRGPLIT